MNVTPPPIPDSQLPTPRPSAFTLLELIAVMVLMAVILAMTAPSLRGFVSGRQSDDAARAMLTMIQWGRMQATSQRRAYRFHVEPQTGLFYLTAQDGSAFVASGDSFGRKLSLPEGVAVEWREPAIVAERGYITIQPTGRAEPAVLVMIDRGEHRQYLRCDAPGEPFYWTTTEQTEEQW